MSSVYVLSLKLLPFGTIIRTMGNWYGDKLITDNSIPLTKLLSYSRLFTAIREFYVFALLNYAFLFIFFSCFYFISKICTVYQDSTFISLVGCFLSQCSFAYPNSSCYSKVYLLSILLQICLTLIVVQCFLLTHCFSFRTICITLL